MSKRKIYSADLETDPFEFGHFPAPFWSGIYDGKKHVTFWGSDCVELLMEILTTVDGIVYFHNGGKFDFHFILPYLPDEIEVFMIGSRLVSIKFAKCELRDSFAILPVALKQSGNKKEIDYALFTPDKREENRELIEDYARQDNVALYQMVNQFINDYGLFITLASAAFNQLKLLGIHPPKGNRRKDEVLRDFYFGGRVQTFEGGIIAGNLKYVDINSAYPFAMMEKHCFDQSFYVSDKIPRTQEYFNASFFEVTCNSKGALPMRTKTGISFPVGKNRFFATGWELKAGIDTGTITDITYHVVHKPNTLQDFKPFVEKFYKLKASAEKNKDSMGRLFAKLMLNSCYGKFAIDPRKFKDYELCPLGEYIEGAQHKCDLDAAGFSVFASEVPEDKVDKAFKNVGTAASITGYVRAYLWRALCAVERPLYCDTDSIICYDTGALPLGDKLGEWDLEETASEVAIAGKKLYALKLTGDKGFKLASKGVRATPEQVYSAAKGGVVTIKNEAPTYSLISTSKFIVRNIKKTIDERSPNPFI